MQLGFQILLACSTCGEFLRTFHDCSRFWKIVFFNFLKKNYLINFNNIFKWRLLDICSICGEFLFGGGGFRGGFESGF